PIVAARRRVVCRPLRSSSRDIPTHFRGNAPQRERWRRNVALGGETSSGVTMVGYRHESGEWPSAAGRFARGARVGGDARTGAFAHPVGGGQRGRGGGD